MKEKARIINQIATMKAKGLSYGKIGLVFGISRQRVFQILKGYGDLTNSALFHKIRELVLARDSSCCQRCGKAPKELCVHHIDGDDLNNNWNNLITLCRTCHAKVHFPNCHKSIASKQIYICVICGKSIERIPYNVRGKRQVCSQECKTKYLRSINFGFKPSLSKIKCAVCGKEKFRNKKRIAKAKVHTCSNACRIKLMRSH